MRKLYLTAFLFLLLILCACTKQPAMHPASENPITEAPEQPENQSTALDSGNSKSTAQAEAQDSQSESLEQSAFTGGITLYADSPTAFVNSEPIDMPAAPFVENGIFYIPLQFVAETMGWSYQKQNDIVTLRFGNFETELTIAERSICIDGEQTTVNRYDWQFSEADADCDPYVPIVRENAVFIPYNFLSTRTEQDILSRLSFRTQWFPEEGYAILSGHGKEDGLGGFYVWDLYDALPEVQRAGMEELSVVGFSRESYDVVEYGADGLFVHVLRLRDGCEDMDRLDGVISAVYTTNPEIATARGLHVGQNASCVDITYDSNFYMNLLCITEDDIITKIRFFNYYDEDEAIRTQPTGLHMDAEEIAEQGGSPSSK